MSLHITNLDILPLIDLTSLNQTDSYKSINKFISKANNGFQNIFPASVCVYPKYASLLKEKLNSNINKCVVSTYFPSSQASTEQKINEIKSLDRIDIDEIDIVLPIGEFLDGNEDEVLNELILIRNTTSKALKLILETGVLKSTANIERAGRLGIKSGMNFLKTSTGKTNIGATIEAAECLANLINQSKNDFKNPIGIKVAGGIRTRQDAEQYMNSIAKILGQDFIQPKTFRIGASSLYNQLID